MAWFIICLKLLSAGCAFKAAWLWYRASKVPMPPFPFVGTFNSGSDFSIQYKALQLSGSLNARAALYAGFSAVIGGILMFV
jgi:hypothetical protein